jgi:hypothetical protein
MARPRRQPRESAYGWIDDGWKSKSLGANNVKRFFHRVSLQRLFRALLPVPVGLLTRLLVAAALREQRRTVTSRSFCASFCTVAGARRLAAAAAAAGY